MSALNDHIIFDFAGSFLPDKLGVSYRRVKAIRKIDSLHYFFAWEQGRLTSKGRTAFVPFQVRESLYKIWRASPPKIKRWHNLNGPPQCEHALDLRHELTSVTRPRFQKGASASERIAVGTSRRSQLVAFRLSKPYAAAATQSIPRSRLTTSSHRRRTLSLASSRGRFSFMENPSFLAVPRDSLRISVGFFIPHLARLRGPSPIHRREKTQE